MRPLEIHHHPETELEVKIEVREREREREREKPMAFQPSKIWIAMMGWLENMGTWNGYKRVVITVEHMKMHKLA
jgi:hypothetical protein